MPLAVFETNVSASSLDKDFANGLSHILAERLHRDKEDISVHIKPDQLIILGGSSDPTGYVVVFTSREFGSIEDKRHTAQAILDFIKEKLKLRDAKRFMVYMHKMCGDNIGLDGGLVSDRYGCMGEGGPFDVRYCKWKKGDNC